jgi:hypothetical protein
MKNYWSCSKIANIIRGTGKPLVLSAKGWEDWESDAKSKYPIRYWIADELIDYIQNIITWVPDRVYSLKYYVVNRWVDQSHALVSHPKHIKPGQYRDFDSRILICLFDELADFVEIEKAYSNYRWSEEKQKGMKWWQVGRWRTRTWRSPEAGLQHLEWETSLTDEEWLDEDKKHEVKPTAQALVATEIIALYKWWTEVYPNRPDPYDLSGWSAHCKSKRVRGIGFMHDDPEEDHVETRKILDKNREIEAAYEAEDTEMLIRLIKNRNSLWT